MTVFLGRISLLSVAIVVITSSVVAAQSPVPAPPSGATTPTRLVWTPEFARQVAGRKLTITRSDGEQFEGVVTVSPTGLSAGGQPTAAGVPFDQVVKVETVSHRIRNYTLTGLGIGAVVGTGVYASSDCEAPVDGGCGQIFGFSLLGTAAGVAIGAILNHTHRDRDVIFDANRRTTTMAFAPILSPTRKGMAFSMTWR